MSEAPQDDAEVQGDPLDWATIFYADPEAQKGIHNTYRKTLLKPGVYVDMDRMTAESWLPGLRERNTAAGKMRLFLGGERPTSPEPPVRVTIVEIPEETKNSPIGGSIVVETDDGFRATIDSSVFYNCIRGKDTCPIALVTKDGSSANLFGTSEPTRGDTSHSSFHRSSNS